MAVFYQATVVNSAATSGAQTWIPLDIHSEPFDVSFFVRKNGTGDVTFRVEHTPDNVLTLTSGTECSGRPFTHSDVTAGTGTTDGNYRFQVRAIRLFTTTPMSGQSSLEFTVLQGDRA